MKNAVLTRMRKNVCRNFPAAGVSLLLAAVFCLIFSYYSSPLTPQTYGWNSSFFQLVGASMTKGFLPYRHFFDNKGPYLFLLEWLGQTVCYGRGGVFILEVLSVSTSCFLCYKIAALFIKKVWICFGSVIILLGVMTIFFDGGNTVGEWCLPLSMLCVYLFAKHYIKNPDMPHPAKYAFWYGLCFMTIVLTRMIDAAVICAVVFAALVMLLKDKQYKALFQNMGTFLLGCAVSIVPVLIWGIANNLLYDIFYCSFIFAFRYATGGGASFTWPMLLLLIPAFYMVFFWKQIRLVFRLFFLSGITASMIALCVGIGRIIYGMLFVPLIILSIDMLIEVFITYHIQKNRKSWFMLFGVLMIFITQAETVARKTYDAIKMVAVQPYKEAYEACVDIADYIPENERDSVGLYLGDSLYCCAIAEIIPYNRYCGWQDHYISLDPNIAIEFDQMLTDNPPIWMLTIPDYDKIDDHIAKHLQTEYELYAENERHWLFRRKTV